MKYINKNEQSVIINQIVTLIDFRKQMNNHLK